MPVSSVERGNEQVLRNHESSKRSMAEKAEAAH